jgi:hypothetical protein
MNCFIGIMDRGIAHGLSDGYELRRWLRILLQTSFSLQITGVLVAADSGEARMTQTIVGRPFPKFDPCDYERF